MSEKHPTEVEQAQLRVSCPRCEAEPGRWCFRWQRSTKLGEYRATLTVKVSSLHAARFHEATRVGLLPLPRYAK
jgi:hypothetical protein